MSASRFRGTAMALALWMMAGLMTGCSPTQPSVEGLNIRDAAGESLATLTSADIMGSDTLEAKIQGYLDVVWNEAVEIIAQMEKCDAAEAEQMLLTRDYCVDTYYDSALMQAIEQCHEERGIEGMPFACAMTDGQGRLCAVYTSGSEMELNYATQPLSPCSTFKPLSVYAPALEAGVIDWSTLYKDSPYKKIIGNAGKEIDWPANASGRYSYGDMTVCQAVKESINTVAVKCLSEYGVERSIDFLEGNFAIDLTYEREKVEQSGPDEVIGNLALGYPNQGVSVVDMAGYYQIFSQAGVYTLPQTIETIWDSQGNPVYQREEKSSQVIGADTAAVMNEMLRTVVEPGGTGQDAGDMDVPVGGKTGTGSDGSDNWFVGFVPQYTCAVWYKGVMQGNMAAWMFRGIMEQLPLDQELDFPEKYDVRQGVYCLESGLIASQACRKLGQGYYLADQPMEMCTTCGREGQ